MASHSQDINHNKSSPPFDVLAQVFDIYTNILRLDHPDLSNAAIPWILGQVCRSWRQVAISVPKCWNRFTLEVTDANADGELPEMLRELIKRCGDIPFCVSFDFAPLTDEISSYPYRVLESMIHHSSRWGEIMVRGLDVTDISQQFSRVKGRLDHLHSLKVYFRSSMSQSSTVYGGYREGPPVFDLFGVAPTLSEVLFNDMTGHLPKFKLTLPWSQLKVYVVYGTKNDIFPADLWRQPNLETLICMHNRFPSPAPGQPHLTHYHLRHLHLHFSRDMEACLQRLNEVSLPALEAISITLLSSEAYYSTSSIPGIASLVSRSNCKLKTLVIQQISSLDVDLLPSLLSEIPSLETLDIGNGLCFESILPLLRFNKTEPTLLPNLRRLAVSYSASVRPSDIQLISDIVESRQRVSEGISDPGQLFAPLLYVRIFIKSSGVLDNVFFDLDDRALQSSVRNSNTPYAPNFLSADNFIPEMNRALDNIRPIIESTTPISPSDSDKIAAEYHFIKKLYYGRILRSSSSYLRSTEEKLMESLRSLCRVYIPPEYLEKRRWILGIPSNILYLHPEHTLRKSARKLEIITGVKYPEKYPLEGYHDWFDEHSNKVLEILRPFTI